MYGWCIVDVLVVMVATDGESDHSSADALRGMVVVGLHVLVGVVPRLVVINDIHSLGTLDI